VPCSRVNFTFTFTFLLEVTTEVRTADVTTLLHHLALSDRIKF